VFEDEFACAFTDALAPTWAPCGQTPHLKRIGYFRRVFSMTVGLTLSGRIFTRQYAKAITGTQIVETLAYFRRRLRRPFIVIWDGARAHLSGKIKAYLVRHPEIMIERLPPYAPELNPEEYCHGHVKQQLRNLRVDDTTQLRRLLKREFARLRRRPKVLLGFIHHAGLTLKHLS
jgi:transposase